MRTSLSYAPSSSEVLHYCVSHRSSAGPASGAREYVGSDSRTLQFADAESTTNVCLTIQPINLYSASTMHGFSRSSCGVMIEEHADSRQQDRRCALLELVVRDGQPYDHVAGSGRHWTGCGQQRYPNVWPKYELFSIEFAKEKSIMRNSRLVAFLRMAVEFFAHGVIPLLDNPYSLSSAKSLCRSSTRRSCKVLFPPKPIRTISGVVGII